VHEVHLSLLDPKRNVVFLMCLECTREDRLRWDACTPLLLIHRWVSVRETTVVVIQWPFTPFNIAILSLFFSNCFINFLMISSGEVIMSKTVH
jgi:hypothetical protein